MIVEAGFIIFFGLLFIFAKLPKRIALRLLGRPLLIDATVTVLVTLIHWGTFSGLIAAAFAGMMTSIFTTGARWLWGYIVEGKYHPGKVHLDPRTLI